MEQREDLARRVTRRRLLATALSATLGSLLAPATASLARASAGDPAADLPLAAVMPLEAPLMAPRTFPAASYGAVGDGRSNDAPAIQAALDAAAAAGGGRVALAPGTFLIGATLRVPSNVQLVGAGSATVLSAADQLNTHVLRNADEDRGNAGVLLASFVVEGNKQRQTALPDLDLQTLIRMRRLSNSRIQGVWVRNGIAHGIGLATAAGVAVESCTAERCNGIGIACVALAGTSSHDVRIRTNICRDNGLDGIIVDAGYSGDGTVHHITVQGNLCEGNDQGITVEEGCLQVSVLGNTCQNNRSDGIAVQKGQTDLPVRNSTVAGNTCRNNGNRGLYVERASGCTFTNNTLVGNQAGVYALNAAGCAFLSNTASRNAGYGIALNQSANCTVGGNTCTNNGQVQSGTSQDGIRIEGSSPAPTGNQVSGNLCTDDQPRKTQQYGIHLSEQADYTLIADNDLRGNAVAGLLLVGSHNVVQNNLGA